MNSVQNSQKMETHSVSLLCALPCALPCEAEETPGVETENPHYSCAVTYFANSLANQNTEKKIFGTSQTIFSYCNDNKKKGHFFLVQTKILTETQYVVSFFFFFNWGQLLQKSFQKK